MLFLFVEVVLRLLGIIVEDFAIAGGIILFLISVGDLVNVENLTKRSGRIAGASSHRSALIVGPAVLTTLMLLGRKWAFPTAIAMFLI